MSNDISDAFVFFVEIFYSAFCPFVAISLSALFVCKQKGRY